MLIPIAMLLPTGFEPVEILLDQMTRNDVDHAVLIQINGVYDNSYLVECLRPVPGPLFRRVYRGH